MDRYRSRRYRPASYDEYAATIAAIDTEATRSRVFGPGYEEIYSPTSGGDRPRAMKAGYNYNMQTLVIIMRDKYTWVQYDQVTPEMWDELKSAPSTNDYVNTVLAGWPWMVINYGALPRTRGQHFELGFDDYI
jgi:hypothetical protein